MIIRLAWKILVGFIKLSEVFYFIPAGKLFNKFAMELLSDSLARFGCVIDKAFESVIWASLVLILILELRFHVLISNDKISVLVLDLGPLDIYLSLLKILNWHRACLGPWSWRCKRFVHIFYINEWVFVINVIDIHKFWEFSWR